MTNKELLIAALQRVVDEVMTSAGGRVSDEAIDQARAILHRYRKRRGRKAASAISLAHK